MWTGFSFSPRPLHLSEAQKTVHGWLARESVKEMSWDLEVITTVRFSHVITQGLSPTRTHPNTVSPTWSSVVTDNSTLVSLTSLAIISFSTCSCSSIPGYLISRSSRYTWLWHCTTLFRLSAETETETETRNQRSTSLLASDATEKKRCKMTRCGQGKACITLVWM